MVFPSTSLAAVLLLLLSVLCLSLWPFAYKAAGALYRFEVFSLDFAVGALLVSLLAAYTLGTLGSELSFGDSMLVAGHRAEFMAFSAGALFAAGNMLLLCTISLVGIPRAILLASAAAASVIGVLAIIRASYAPASASLLLFLLSLAAAILAIRAAKTPGAAPTPQAFARPGVRSSDYKRLARGTKGVITGVVSGLFLGSVLPAISLAQTEELGIGPYGGVLMGCIGIFVATPVLNFYFMNLAIEGPTLQMKAYIQGRPTQRLLGLLGGAMWAAGTLALYVVAATAKSIGKIQFLAWAVPFAAPIITAASGWFVRPDASNGPVSHQRLLYGALVLFLGGALFLIAAETQNFSM